MNRSAFAYLAITLLAGCAATYEQPRTLPPTAIFPINGSAPEIMKKAKIALVNEGYQITGIDESAGVISTAPRDLRVTPTDADCGTTMGIDYLKDKRTTTRVSIGVIASDGLATIKATIQGEYKPGDVSQNITLTCVSRGTIEPVIARQISET